METWSIIVRCGCRVESAYFPVYAAVGNLHGKLPVFDPFGGKSHPDSTPFTLKTNLQWRVIALATLVLGGHIKCGTS